MATTDDAPARELATAPWICMDCGATQADAGQCARCGQGPLVDGRDAAVRDGCRALDDRARERHDYKLYAIAYGPVFTVSVLVAAVLSWVLAGIVFAVGAPVAALAQRGLKRAWPAKARFPYLTAG